MKARTRFPRTMEEAFGCGSHNRSGYIHPMPESHNLHPHDKVAIALIAGVAGVATLGYALIVWLTP